MSSESSQGSRSLSATLLPSLGLTTSVGGGCAGGRARKDVLHLKNKCTAILALNSHGEKSSAIFKSAGGVGRGVTQFPRDNLDSIVESLEMPKNTDT